MLTYKLRRDHLGIKLLGHLSDFDALRGIVHDVAARSPLIKDKEETPFLVLAELLRKAYDKDPDSADHGGMQEAELDWMRLLVTSRVLRDSLAFIDHGKHHQAATYALEAVVDDGLREDFAWEGGAAVDAWNRVSGNDASLLERMGDFIETYARWDAGTRRKSMVALLVDLGSPWRHR